MAAHEDTVVHVQQYNYPQFRARHVLEEVARSLRTPMVRPGELAPDFRLPRVGGGDLHLRALLGHVVLLRFASIT